MWVNRECEGPVWVREGWLQQEGPELNLNCRRVAMPSLFVLQKLLCTRGSRRGRRVANTKLPEKPQETVNSHLSDLDSVCVCACACAWKCTIHGQTFNTAILSAWLCLVGWGWTGGWVHVSLCGFHLSVSGSYFRKFSVCLTHYYKKKSLVLLFCAWNAENESVSQDVGISLLIHLAPITCLKLDKNSVVYVI